MNFLFLLIAIAIVGSFLYGLGDMWRRIAVLFLQHHQGQPQPQRWYVVITLLIAMSLPTWFAWQVWMAYGF